MAKPKIKSVLDDQHNSIQELKEMLEESKWEYAQKKCEFTVEDCWEGTTEEEADAITSVIYPNKWAATKAYINQVQSPIQEKAKEAPYVPKMSGDGRLFLRRMIEAIGEDEARRLLAKLNDLIVDKEFSISEYIDNKIVEFSVTRE